MQVYRSLVIAALFALALPAYAQGIPTGDTLSIVVNPQYPRPYQTITISPRSTLINLSASTIVITVNGVEVERGSGQVVGYGRTGAPGERTTIRVTATNEGRTYTKEMVLRPADVSLIIEPLSTTHPFYKGAGLVSSEGRVRLVAMPDIRTSAGAVVSPQNLIYTWRLGSRTLEAVSGIGKFSVEATAPVRYRDVKISVTATTQDSAVVAYAETLISPVDPILRIYKSDPLLGPLFDTAYIGSTVMQNDEETYRVVPYYFNGTPSVAWSVNSVESTAGKNITVRATGSGAGSAVLSAAVRGSGLFQTADTSLTVRFGESNSLGIFGL